MYGLGVDMVTDLSTGQQIDCDLWSNLFNSTCWGFGAAVDATVGVPSTLTILPPAVPPAPTQTQLDAVAASPDPGAAAQALVQQLTNQALAQSQANISSANPPGGTPDCSAFLAPFITPGCGSTFSLGEWIAVAGAVIGGILLLQMLTQPLGRRR